MVGGRCRGTMAPLELNICFFPPQPGPTRSHPFCAVAFFAGREPSRALSRRARIFYYPRGVQFLPHSRAWTLCPRGTPPTGVSPSPIPTMETVRTERFPQLFWGMVALGLGLVLASLIGAAALKSVKRAGDQIEVTGSFKKQVRSDYAVWKSAIAIQGPDLQGASAEVAAD